MSIAQNYSMDVFKTFFTLRMLPTFLHPLAGLLLPARHRTWSHLRQAEKLVREGLDDSRRRAALRYTDPESYHQNITLMDWMVENAKGEEADPKKLSARQLILTLASVYTTTNAVLNVLFDLCEHPQYLEPLREEIESICGPGQLAKQDLNKLQKLDSFMRESQRFNPAVFCMFPILFVNLYRL